MGARAGMSGISVLLYHWFRPTATPSGERASRWEIGADRFARQMRFLQKHGYRGVPLTSAMRATPGERLVALTFDDGTRDFWDHAVPCLERFGFRGTVFVVTGRVGATSDWDRDVGEPPRDLMDWPQLVDLHRRGFEIASHTHTHRVLTSLSDKEAAHEFGESRRLLAERIGVPPDLVAYPRGIRSDRDCRLARDAGYRAAASVILQWRDLRSTTAPGSIRELSRMPVKGDESMLRFRLRLVLARRAGVLPLVEAD